MKALKKLAPLSPYLLVFLIFFLPAIDTDLGWHLRYGEHFLNTGKILRENTLTYFLSTYEWSHSYTLYQIFTTLIYRSGSLISLAIAYGFLGVTLFYLFNKINKLSPNFSLVLFLLFTIFSWNVFSLGWRAQVFTILFILIEFWILQKSEKSQKWLFLLATLFVIWANTHGGFILGVLVLCFKTLDLSRGVISVPPRRWNSTYTLGFCTLLSTAATFINPYGLNIWQETLKHSQYPLHTLIAEWVKPSLVISVYGVVIVVTLLAFIWVRKAKEKSFYTLILLLGLFLLFEAKRNTAIFSLFAILTALRIFKNEIVKLESNKTMNTLRLQLFSHLTIVSSVIVFAIIRIPHTISISTNWESYCGAARFCGAGSYCTKGLVKYPCKSVNFIRANPVSGKNMYSAYEWGGFLEWQLPQYKPFVDGRMPTWSDLSPYTEYLEIIQAQPGWDKKLEDYKTDWLLIGNGTFLDIELKSNPRVEWKELYRDEVSVVYTKI
ncbi:MAG: hypothetical protein AAB599_03520 [Patescibacteria group bacterium]